MMRRTHAAAGLALGYGLASIQHQPIILGTVLALACEAAAILPDLDIRLRLKHRGVTHSLLMVLVISLGMQSVAPSLLLPVALGYGSHLLLDLLTVWGIPIFWPIQKRFRLMKLVTGEADHAVVSIILFLWLAVTILYGQYNGDLVKMFTDGLEMMRHVMDCAPPPPVNQGTCL